MRTFLALACLLALACAAPKPTTHRIHRSQPSVSVGAHDIAMDSVRYRAGSRVPVTFAEGAGGSYSGSTSVSVEMSGGFVTLGAYFLNIDIGKPSQSLPVLVDTGSSNLGVPSSMCSSCSSNASTIYYNPSASSESSPMGCASAECQRCVPVGSEALECVFGPPVCSVTDGNCGFGITYGGGSSALAGSYYYDQVCLGGNCVESVPVGLIYESVQFSDPAQPFVGIFGLASDMNACNPSCVDTVYDSLVGAGYYANIFGMCLTPSAGGSLDLGYADSAKYSGELSWVPMTTDRWYNIAINDILVGGTSLGLPVFVYRTTNDVIGSFVDSGTSVVLMGPAIYEALVTVFQESYCSLPGVCGNNSLFDGACYPSSTIDPVIDQYPNITFVVGGINGTSVNLELPASSYIVDFGENTSCLGMGGVPSLGVILGDVFMQNYYIAFDRQNQQLGFAPVIESKCVG